MWAGCVKEIEAGGGKATVSVSDAKPGFANVTIQHSGPNGSGFTNVQVSVERKSVGITKDQLRHAAIKAEGVLGVGGTVVAAVAVGGSPLATIGILAAGALATGVAIVSTHLGLGGRISVLN